MVPWTTLATADTPEGRLELRQRGKHDFLIVIGGRVLMASASRSSEEQLATRALAEVAAPSPRVLIGGLGMGFTLRAALDALPATAKVTVAELDPTIVAWCNGPLAPATKHAVGDRRVTLQLGDVAAVIAAAAPGAYHAIVLDLYEGPNAASQARDDPFYGPTALARTRAALAAGGVLGVWSEDADAPFAKRLAAARFAVTTHRIGTGGRRHVIYLGRR